MQLLWGSDCVEFYYVVIRLQACCEWLSGRCYEVAKFDCLKLCLYIDVVSGCQGVAVQLLRGFSDCNESCYYVAIWLWDMLRVVVRALLC